MIKKIFIYTTFLTIFALSSILVVLLYTIMQGPPVYETEENTIVYDQDEQVVTVRHGNENRHSVPLEEISPHVIDAFIAAEDQHFYDHFGFDMKRIASAVYHNIRSLDKTQGASTITQQYARNVFLTHTKTWTRKIQEAMLALRLEIFESKEDILLGYLNTIYFGHGQYGIEAASNFYFDKSAIDLDASESAALAAIPKGASVYSPLVSEDNNKERQEWILSRMNDIGTLNQEDYSEALHQHLNFKNPDEIHEETADYFVDYALKEASDLLDLDRAKMEEAGYRIYTTLNQDAQRKLESNVYQHLPRSQLQIGAVTLEQATGKIVALQGGRDFESSSFNRVTQAKRMTGSTFKPFLYYAALVYGYTPATTLESTPTSFTLDNGEVYAPTNFNDYYAEEPITLAQAVALSDNIYAVKTNLFVQPENLVESARVFGIDEDLPAVPSLALGTASVSVMEMANAYSLIANNGWSVEPYVIEKITNREGEIVYQHQAAVPERILDEKYSAVLTSLLTGMFDERLNGYMNVTGSSISDILTRDYAGKSGTTPNDSWMIGYSPDYTTAVWTGYDQNEELTGNLNLQAAKNVWANYMEELHAGLPRKSFEAPPGVDVIKVDPVSGKLSGPGCEERAKIMYFLDGTAPVDMCDEVF
ncbi:transglycosylase domain-containing protein [Halalkalibacillus halophilus]|uniref:transglycosylase domain-containing protein n=1 Tax=Halalkalibacillus halophilus TaxID=392827 RepID=UPI000423E320|nr:PBP1A family penicillin-binding protein [Halalkalibacillus halophilus]